VKIEIEKLENGGNILPKHTCDGEGLSPAISFSEIPIEAKSLVLIMDDPDASAGIWDHWILFNISPNTQNLKEGDLSVGKGGKNSWGEVGYGGPCPGVGKHRYFFKLYALDKTLDLPEGSIKSEIEKEMEGHILDETKIVGLYERSQKGD